MTLIGDNNLNKAIEKAMRSLGKGINADGINIYIMQHDETDKRLYAHSFMRWLQVTDAVDLSFACLLRCGADAYSHERPEQ